jgi:adhesin transport system membrane fusion protein
MSLRETWHGWDSSRRLIASCAVGIGVLGLWAGFAQVDEITRGTGKVIPSSKVQLVQAVESSVVAAIDVRPGQPVQKGQLLGRLESAQSQSQRGQLEAENERLTARAARLSSEGGGGGSDCGAGTICAEEAQLAAARRATAASRQSALSAAVEQRRRDLSEGQATVNSLEGSVRLAQQQVDTLAPMVAKKVIPQTELLAAQRELVDLQGRLSAARQGMARASASIAEAQAQVNEARNDFRQQALAERSEVATKIAVNEAIKGSSAELRAPVTGFVNDVRVSTVGGFVNAGDMIMQIVPQGDKLLVETRVTPKDIAFIKVGDPVVVKVTAYDFSTYGGLSGRVRNISADSIYDEDEREAYYIVTVETDKSTIVKGKHSFPIMPGMICDVEIITGQKSILSYLFKPVLKAFSEAMTER